MIEQTSRSYRELSKFVSKEELITLVETYINRKFDEEIILIENRGGIDKFQELLDVDFRNGINSNSRFEKRIAAYGKNKREEKRLFTFLEFCCYALRNKVLIMLLFMGVLNLILGDIIRDHHQGSTWFEGFAILIAGFIAVVIASVNNYLNQKQFAELRSQKNRAPITVLRGGVQIFTPKRNFSRRCS
ncbi:unnamed protein product [Blepharisma stoltei]|uniref:Cation-transporting P-type ATPase N-terminal domain-containing protein n=1 Tax=Blepharisma stoltei TaxID=1481888 RepID=A0AAU9KER4_9CILI|nr:unnamed protein product [Blepharisma stoltei]